MGAILWLPSVLFSSAPPTPVDQPAASARETPLPAAPFHRPDTVSAGQADDRISTRAFGGDAVGDGGA